MFHLTKSGQKLYYEIHGNKSSHETLVFLNGLTQSTQSWNFVVPYFQQNFKIILLDFIFQGQSDKHGIWKSFDEHAEDLKSLLQELKIYDANILGISYGSVVAQHFAVNHPKFLKRLILISTFAHKTPYYDALELGWWRALESGGYNLMIDIMLPASLSESYFSNPLIPIETMRQMRRERNLSTETLINLMRATKERKDYRNELKKISMPTLIIQGEKDLLFPVHVAEEVHKKIKNSKFVIIKNAGHTLNLEHVPEVCNTIKEFLK